MEPHTSLKILFLRLLFLPFFLTRGAVAGEEQAGDAETAWLSFSIHDIELVAKEHKNATVLLLLRGTTHDCFSVNFTYDPIDPTIVPISNFIFCPDLPPASTTLADTPSAPKGCRGCERGPAKESREDGSLLPSYPQPIPLHLLLGWGLRVGGSQLVYSEGEEVVANVEVVSRWVGKTVLGVTTNCSRVGVVDAYVRVSVIHNHVLNVASEVLGWMYAIVWDISFIPQIWLNWRRKNVEGLSLDNVTLNTFAYLNYSLFNIGLYWITLIKDQFHERYPRTVSHVQPNDVFFATYSLAVQMIVVVQCLLYGRNKGLSVSWPCIGFVVASVLAILVDCVLVAFGVVWWLDVFYLMSYIKLIITPLKYIPQVYVIYLNKSTEGFSVFGIVLDFIGGSMALMQMMLLSANSDDYVSIFTNFTKFGLSVITLFFDIIYFGQQWYYHLRFRK